ncbi:MAG: hypothetical protein HUU29_13640 [Planctomycetaceae bacterium]|nr:hypothetical protein [Planctomycetaceae bacterium]
MKTLSLCFAVLVITACASNMLTRVDSNVRHAKLKVWYGDDVKSFTLPSDIGELEDDQFVAVEAAGYESFTGKVSDLEKVGDKSYFVTLRPVK